MTLAAWPSGKAGACKALIPGSNPGAASIHNTSNAAKHHIAEVERLSLGEWWNWQTRRT